MDNMQALCKIYKLAKIYDETCAPQEAFRRLYTEFVAPAAAAAGLQHGAAPIPSPESLEEFIKNVNKEIDLEVPLHPTSHNAGWLCDLRFLVRTMVKFHEHENDCLTSPVNDVLVLAMGTDKAPVHHTGRSVCFCHLEDHTASRQGGMGNHLGVSLKSSDETILAAAFETATEDHQTMWDNYEPFRKVIKLYVEGFDTGRLQLNELRGAVVEAHSAYTDAVADRTSWGFSDEDIECLRLELESANKAVADWYVEAEQKGWVEHVEGRGYFFVEMHGIMDMACLRSAVKVEGKGSAVKPCACCMKEWKDFDNLDLPPGDPRNIDDNVFGLPAHRFHPCSMHAKHRITERVLYQLMNWLDVVTPRFESQGYPKVAAELRHRRNVLMQLLNAPAYQSIPVVQFEGEGLHAQGDEGRGIGDHAGASGDGADEDGLGAADYAEENTELFETGEELDAYVINVGGNVNIDAEVRSRTFRFTGMNVNGGRCRFNYDHTSKLIMIGMNGDEVKRYLAQAENLFLYIMADLDPDRAGKWIRVVKAWNSQVEYMESLRLPDEEYRNKAISEAKQFVKLYYEAAGPGSITYYLHTLHDHTEWFYCAGPNNEFSLVAWWSAQAVEAGHKKRKKALRSHTRHGMEINVWRYPDETDEMWGGEQIVDGDEYTDGDGRQIVIKRLRRAAAIYELFRWQFRLVCYKLLDNKERRDKNLCLVRVGQLNKLAKTSALTSGTLLTEAQLLDAFKFRSDAKIRLVGPGKLDVALNVQVSEATYYAMHAIKQAGGQLTVKDPCHKGRQPWAELSDSRKEAINASNAGRKRRKADVAVNQMGYETYRLLVRNAAG